MKSRTEFYTLGGADYEKSDGFNGDGDSSDPRKILRRIPKECNIASSEFSQTIDGINMEFMINEFVEALC
ncbi:hypothetical protein K0M31_005875 [Melipona bicolor]|uniref:Uncharacterized protein n=1 Tax=Melipona bicolor TaxID=60889 RepID=A0AA40FUA2_9HYME|nr:hypothetical protein K0M31_005875 [Melipona bicolor]